ncbi:Bardet-Biedl syndrome 1 protein-like [Rhipicephalus sanguineus]|uniref:Bardet-Biedl syndrome 1 protein-like n=1 Tax=Rhipicephalus sanguineus TaxID=34632 RepID=UPI00189392DA|nr:Bardet-Biedl syndrome 1 protein-like [Rhipicephalus sanguineus]
MDMTSSASVTSGSGSGGGAWLRAHHDPYASLYALPGGLCTADVLADGDQRLLVADLRNGGRLRLFRGGRQQQQGEQALAALPCGLAAFRTESAPPGQPPSVAVAAGSCLYVYRNLRPFYKFSLPHTAADEEEKEAWSKHQDPDALREALETLRSQGGMGRLTARSQRFLLLEPEEAKAFVEANWEFPLKRQTQVTALGVLKKSLADEDAASCLLLATEDGRLFVLEPDAFTLLAAVQVPGAVCCLDAQGAFDVDFHVALATRDDRLHLVKRGHKASRVLAEPGAPAVGLCHLEPGQLVAACADRRLRAYSLKGQCAWSVSLGAQPLAVAAVCRPGVCQAAAVALSDRRVVLHGAADGAPTHVLNTRDAVSAIHFGRLGREDNALVMVGTGGSLTVLILRRNAQLLLGGPRWSLPKKTKLFVDQTMREREHSVAMHRGFLRDLQRLRLTAARHYHRAVLGAAAPARATDDTGAAGPVLVELSAQVQGLGPRLAMHVRLQSSRPLNRLTMVVHGDDQYRLQKPATQVAYLVPGLAYRYTAMVTAESGAAGVLKVVVARQTRVLATALVQMPALDMP